MARSKKASRLLAKVRALARDIGDIAIHELSDSDLAGTEDVFDDMCRRTDVLRVRANAIRDGSFNNRGERPRELPRADFTDEEFWAFISRDRNTPVTAADALANGAAAGSFLMEVAKNKSSDVSFEDALVMAVYDGEQFEMADVSRFLLSLGFSKTTAGAKALNTRAARLRKNGWKQPPSKNSKNPRKS